MCRGVFKEVLVGQNLIYFQMLNKGQGKAPRPALS